MNNDYSKKLQEAFESLDSINLNTLSKRQKKGLREMNRGAFSVVKRILSEMEELDSDLDAMLDPRKQAIFRQFCKALEAKYAQRSTQ